jgi:hypothetical protein
MAVCGNRAKVNAFRQRQAATESRIRGPRKDRQATVNKKA